MTEEDPGYRDYRDTTLRPRKKVYALLPPFSALADWLALVVAYVLVLIFNVLNPIIEGYDIRLLVWAFFSLIIILAYSFREYDRVAYRDSMKATFGDQGNLTIESLAPLGMVPGVKYKEEGTDELPARPDMVAWVVGGKDKPFHIRGKIIVICPWELTYILTDGVFFNVILQEFSLRHRELKEDIVDRLNALKPPKFNIDTPVYMGWTPYLEPGDMKKKAQEIEFDPIAQEKSHKAQENLLYDVIDRLKARIKTPPKKEESKPPGASELE